LKTDLLCLGHPAAFAASLARGFQERIDCAPWIAELRSVREQQRRRLHEVARQSDEVPLHPAAVAAAIADVGQAHDCSYVLDCGEFVQWCRQIIEVQRPGSWTRLGPQSTCGAALPFGLGVKAGNPDRPVLVIAGDGGLGYHIADLETAVRRDLPLVVVVGQDHAWGVERNLQVGIYGEEGAYASDLGPTDFVRVAEGFGAEAYAATSVGDLRTLLDRAVRSPRTTLVQVSISTVPSGMTKSLIRQEQAALEEASRAR
jgi:acetolactate synthase I/II/III large subunit